MEKRGAVINYLNYLLFNGTICSVFFVLIGTFCFFSTLPLTAQSVDQGAMRLRFIHSKLNLIHGSFAEEYPEQLMAATFIGEDAKVLELGANVGRNSCVIASLLNNSKNLVAIESSVDTAKLLKENRDVNGLEFHIEASAISKVPLVQSRWKTIPSDVDLPGYTRVNTISFKQVKEKYRINFDTLVLDCEGAFYYVLRDDPKILKNIKLIIIENDFETEEQMQYVQEHFRNNGMRCVFNQPGGYGPCCYDHFYQVWKK